jgi:ParB/RepB/Spo0J family partition protein
MTTTRINPLLDGITPSPTNPRKHFNEAELAELASSIKEHGIISPILVRTNPNAGADKPLYELISGERRWRAARLAGLTNIPADLRDDLSEAAIIEIQLIENLQRQDLHPLEEAEGYGHMMRQHGYTADTLAEKIGKSRSYIFGRLKLLDLDEDGRRLFYAGTLNASTALLVARIPSHKLQAKAIEDLTKTDWYGDIKSVRQAQRWIRDRYMLSLDDAPFPTEDIELIAMAGCCSGCPKRTGNSPDLFDDTDSANVCTDPDCFTAKKIAASERRAREAGPDVKVVTGEEAQKMLSIYGHETRTHAPLDSPCYDDPKHRTYREILGDDQSAVTLVENAHKGELVPVVAKKVITEKLKAQGVVTRAQETRDENKKIKAQVALSNAFREALFKRIHDSAPENARKIPVLEVLISVVTRRFLIDAGNTRAENVAGLWGAIGANSFDRAEAFRKGLVNYTADDQLRICLDLALLAELKTDEHNLKRDPEGMLAMAKALDIDADALLKEVKESQKPAAKGKKTAKKSAPATSEDDSPPSEAAQAAEINRAREGEGATEAARAGEEDSLEDQNPAPADAEADLSSGSVEPNEKPSLEQPVFEKGDRVRFTETHDRAGQEGVIKSSWNGPDNWLVDIGERRIAAHLSQLVKIELEEILSSGSDEPNAKPSEHADHSFGIGDTVRVNPNLEKHGIPHTSAGKGGVIEAIYIDGRPAPIVVTIDGDELCFEPAELILIAKEAPYRSSRREKCPYQHPEDSELQWSGRGKKPKWVEHWITQGGTLEDLKVEGAAA